MSARQAAAPELTTPHGALRLPSFIPDATRGVVRTVDTTDLTACGVSALMVSIYHLSTHPGINVVGSLGGIHGFAGWPGPVVSDSGGFQLYSLVTQSPERGSVSGHGFSYQEKGGEKVRLTPKSCIERQMKIGADILFCLDYCTHPEADAGVQRESVDLTVSWARQCKDHFTRMADQRGAATRPRLFAVVQGGSDRDLRKQCADQLLEVGFDGYGFGGWPVVDDGALSEMVAYVSDLLPAGVPRHGLGIGKPENIVAAYRAGYRMFDCVLPTRDARHGRLYVFAGRAERSLLDGTEFYEHIHIMDGKYTRDPRPLDPACACSCCAHYSRAYLHHLFRVRDALALRLATIHNLQFFTTLVRSLGERGMD